MSATAPSSTRWLFGPAWDLLLGCGGIYVLILLAFGIGGPELAVYDPQLFFPLMLLLLSTPHYGATLLRVYEHREDRRRYAIFAVWVSLLIFGLFVVGLHSVWVGSLLFTTYVTWGPWHYTGQNYGLAVMFLRRRGIDLPPELKRWLYTSFVLSYGVTIITFHGDRVSGGIEYGLSPYQASSISFLPLGIPGMVSDYLFALIGGAYLQATATCVWRLLRRASARDLLPVGALMLTQALWFSAPLGAAYWGLVEGTLVQDYALWVALGHGAQYLWVTTYYARASQGWNGYLPYLSKTVAAGVAIWTLPAVLFAPTFLGPGLSVSSLAVLIASVVNIHHFVLDGAIWKLREGRVAQILLRSAPRVDASGPRAASAPLRPLVWGALAGWMLFQGAGWLEYQIGAKPALEPVDVERLRASAQRLRWLASSDWEVHYQLGVAAGQQGDYETARREFARSVQLDEDGRAWLGLGFAEARTGHPEGARHAFEKAVALESTSAEMWYRAALGWREIGDLDRARAAAERALELAPDRPGLRDALDELAPRPAS